MSLSSGYNYGRVDSTFTPAVTGYGGSLADNWDTALSGTVTITGTPQQGQVLSVLKQGDWAGQSNFSYQWKRNGTNIFGATGATYTVQAADYGEPIGVDVWFFSSAGVISSASATPVTIVNAPPVGTLAISGAVYSGQTITANPSFSDADTLGTLSYQWYADGVAIPDATASTYVVAEALGTAISVTASYVDGAGNAESVTSSPVLVGSAPPVGSVTIAGTYRVGEELTATVDVSDADGIQEGTTVYQWTRGGADITGATALNYTLVDADIGQAVAMEVRYTDNLGDQESLSSAAAVVLGYPVVLANPLADQETYAGLALSYTVPADAFNDPDGGVLTYAASGMPAWLAFDAASRTFSGTPSVDDVGTSTVTVTATDSDADSASDTFVVAVLARVTESFEFDADDRWPGTLPEPEPNPAFNYSSASTSFDPASGWPAPPSITGSASVSVEENIDVATVVETYTANVSVTWSLAGTDAADFTIDNQGDLRFVQSPDFETKSSYSITVIATDAAGSVSTEAVTVSVTDVLEIPEGLVLSYDVSNSASYPGSGSTLFDLVGSTNGNMTNVTYNSAAGGSLVLGSSSLIDIPSTLGVFAGDFSVSIWYMNTTATGGYKILFETESYRTGPGGFSMYLYDDRFIIWKKGEGMIGTDPGTAGVNVWKNVVLRRSGTTVSLYINGVQAGGTYETAEDFSYNNYNIGGTSYPFQGRVAQLSVHERALSTEEILQNFNASKARFGL